MDNLGEKSIKNSKNLKKSPPSAPVCPWTQAPSGPRDIRTFAGPTAAHGHGARPSAGPSGLRCRTRRISAKISDFLLKKFPISYVWT